MLKRILPLAVAGYALWHWKQHSTQKRHKKVSAKPEEVTTWEGEGGALHAVGPQLGPEPTKSVGAGVGPDDVPSSTPGAVH